MVTFWVLLKSITFKQNLLYLGHLLETFRLFFIPSSGHTELVHKINLIRLDSKTILTGDFNLIILAVFNWACLIRCRMDMTCRKCNRTEKWSSNCRSYLPSNFWLSYLSAYFTLSLCIFSLSQIVFLSLPPSLSLSLSLSLSHSVYVFQSLYFSIFFSLECVLCLKYFFSLSLCLFLSLEQFLFIVVQR